MNVFVKPNEQRRACSDIVMARKRTFEERKKNNLHRVHNAQLPHKLNRHLPNSQPFQTAKLLVFQILFWQTLHTIHLHSHLGWCKTGATPRHQSLKIYPHVSLSAY